MKNQTLSKIPLACVALAMSVLTLIGCKEEPLKEASSASRPTGGTSLKLAFVTNNASEFWKIAAAGVHAYEKEAGVKVDILLPQTGKAEEQNQIIENLVSQGYNGIALSAIAPADQVDVINDAARKTKVITFDSDAEKSNRLCYIGTNNFKAGQTLGQEIVKLMPGGGKIAVFVGTLSADNARQRLEGILDAIKGHKIEVVEKREDQTDRVKARSNVEDVINARPEVTMVVGLWSYNGPAIAAAIDSTGRKGKVKAAVFDEEVDTLAAVEDGMISCTVVQKPYQFGYRAAKMLHELNTKGDSILPAGKKDDTGVKVVDKSNVAEFKAELAKLKR